MIKYISLVEVIVFHKPEGFENLRFFRVEYVEEAGYSRVEGCLWLSNNSEADKIEEILNTMLIKDL